MQSILDKIPNEPKLEEKQAKGTRILCGREAVNYYTALNLCIFDMALEYGAMPIVLPTIEPAQIYTDTAGPEVSGQMYVFKDKGERDLCLRPEATATCKLLGQTTYKTFRDLKVCYWQKCFRYEKPQAGRYREFTQFGVEVLNPTRDWTNDLIAMADRLMRRMTGTYRWIFDPVMRDADVCWTISRGVKRGLGIYNDAGFEFVAEELGAQKQIVGGGPYDGGYGFAIGIDRIMLLKSFQENMKDSNLAFAFEPKKENAPKNVEE